MVISNIIGGLGNQMFQYAAGRALSLRLGVALKLDTSGFLGYKLHQGFELKRLLNCDAEIASEHDLKNVLGWQHSQLAKRFLRKPPLKIFRKKNLVVEPSFNYWDGLRQLNDCVYLDGYWQSERYFNDYAEIVRNDFSFNLPFSDQNLVLAHKISSVNSVSLHVRRGDYVTNAKNAFIGSCPLNYYEKAISFIKSSIQTPLFFVFSDDINWVKSNLKLDASAVLVNHNDGSESYNDMRLMSMCKHQIIANSSFSWWGAWLNENQNKIVIAPKKWFATDKFDSSDLLPPSWIRL